MRGEPPLAEQLEDSLEAYFGSRPARGGGGMYLSLLLTLGLAAALLPVIHLDLTARASGLLRPALERHSVLAGASGTVERVEGRLGAAVRPGDVLVRLRADGLEPRLAAAESTSLELQARAADLTRLILHAGALLGGGRTAAALRAPRLQRYREERDRLDHEWRDLEGETRAAAAESERLRALGRLALAAPAELEQAALRLARARAAARQLAERQRATWAAELEDALGRLREADGRLAELHAQADLLRVRSPVAGTIETLRPLSAGSWVGAGEEVAVVSPEAPLVAEVYVASRDVGRVRAGTRVRLLVDAFDQHEWGALPATVVEIARDYTAVAGRPMFRVRCRPDTPWLRRADGARARPGKGMTVTAAFLLGRRSLLHLLWDRATDQAGEDAGGPAIPGATGSPAGPAGGAEIGGG